MGRAPTGMPCGDSFMGTGPGGCFVAGALTGCLQCTIVHVMHEPFNVLFFLLISMFNDKGIYGRMWKRNCSNDTTGCASSQMQGLWG